MNSSSPKSQDLNQLPLDSNQTLNNIHKVTWVGICRISVVGVDYDTSWSGLGELRMFCYKWSGRDWSCRAALFDVASKSASHLGATIGTDSITDLMHMQKSSSSFFLLLALILFLFLHFLLLSFF